MEKEKTLPILLKAVESNFNSKHEAVRLDVLTEPRKVYSQQQILVRIRIIRTGIEMENETITPLEIAGTQIEKINQATFKTVEDGKKQIVTEISYAVIPEKSGTLTLPQVRYQGNKKNRSNLNRNFGNFGNFDNFFKSRGERIYSSSNIQTVEVLPLPKENKGWWLPATNLKISEKWYPEQPNFKVGEPVTRTLTIIADGVKGNQIPEISLNLPDTIKGYLDQPQIKTEYTELGLRGIRTEKWAIIPNKSGKIILPDISVSWWDVKTNIFRKAVIPAREILVHTELERVEEKISQDIPLDTVYENTVIDDQETANIVNSYITWKNLTIVLAILWAGTLLVLFFNRKKQFRREIKIENNQKNKRHDEIKYTAKKVEQALNIGEPVAIQEALLKWGNSVWFDDPPQGLEQIGERIPKLKKGIKSLNSVLYSSKQSVFILEELKNEFLEMTSNKLPNKNNIKKTNLSTLYPD